jgi:hypothetical protein
MRIVCVAEDVLPMAICVDHPPPNATSAKTMAPAPPMNAVAVDELLAVAGGETINGGAGVGGKPRPNPGSVPEFGSVGG